MTANEMVLIACFSVYFKRIFDTPLKYILFLSATNICQGKQSNGLAHQCQQFPQPLLDVSLPQCPPSTARNDRWDDYGRR